MPETSSANYQPGLGIFAPIYSSISAAGDLNFYTNAPTQLLFDVSGYFVASGGLYFQP
jgi:hypothetical protein